MYTEIDNLISDVRTQFPAIESGRIRFFDSLVAAQEIPGIHFALGEGGTWNGIATLQRVVIHAAGFTSDDLLALRGLLHRPPRGIVYNSVMVAMSVMQNANQYEALYTLDIVAFDEYPSGYLPLQPDEDPAVTANIEYEGETFVLPIPTE